MMSLKGNVLFIGLALKAIKKVVTKNFLAKFLGYIKIYLAWLRTNERHNSRWRIMVES